MKYLLAGPYDISVRRQTRYPNMRRVIFLNNMLWLSPGDIDLDLNRSDLIGAVMRPTRPVTPS